ncbi:MAG: TonB-dependent receptor [Alteromonadales bacterium]|nr:TonB-dependent receptor [Alteromonadales bacterium]
MMRAKMNPLSLLIQGVLLSTTTVAVAEENNQEKNEIEVIKIEARKRVEPLQEVPVAVTVMNAAQIERSHNVKVESLDKFAPNVELGKMQFGGGAITAGIRGISYAEVERTFEPAVGVSVDGVFFGTGVGAMADMFDVSSIEILRGPQGTLFGRNTMGGVINIKRQNPTGEMGLKAEVGYGSNNAKHVKAVFNTGMYNDVLAAKFSVYKNTDDLFTKNFYTGEHEDGQDQITIGAKILYTPTEDVEVILSYDKVDDKSSYPHVVNLSGSNNIFCSAFAGLLGAGACQEGVEALAQTKGYNFHDYDVDYSNTPFKAAIESDLWSLNASIDLSNELSFESITGYQDVKDLLTGEVTAIPDFMDAVPVFWVERDQVYDQFSQEFRLTSDYSDGFNFVAGLYYFESEFSMQPQNGVFLGAPSFTFYVNQKVEAYALFAEAYYEISPELRLTLGGRYTKEEKEFSAERYAYNPVDPTDIRLGYECPNIESTHAPCQNPIADWSRFSPRVSLDYKISEDLMTYFSYSQGFRSGGWVGRAAVDFNIGTYEPEVLDSFEAGFRSEWLDNTLRLNATVFYMDYKDKQEDYTVEFVDSFGTPSNDSRVENGAAATISGLEVEFQYSITPDWVIRSALGLLDSKYDEYLAPGPDGVDVDVSDQRHYRFAPDLTFSLGTDYFFDISDNEFIFTVNYKYTDEFWVTPQFDPLELGRDKIDSNNQLDVSLNATFDNIKVSIYGDNITQSNGRLFRKFDAGAFHFGDKEVGRTFGVNFGIEF